MLRRRGPSSPGQAHGAPKCWDSSLCVHCIVTVYAYLCLCVLSAQIVVCLVVRCVCAQLCCIWNFVVAAHRNANVYIYISEYMNLASHQSTLTVHSTAQLTEHMLPETGQWDAAGDCTEAAKPG